MLHWQSLAIHVSHFSWHSRGDVLVHFYTRLNQSHRHWRCISTRPCYELCIKWYSSKSTERWSVPMQPAPPLANGNQSNYLCVVYESPVLTAKLQVSSLVTWCSYQTHSVLQWLFSVTLMQGHFIMQQLFFQMLQKIDNITWIKHLLSTAALWIESYFIT